MDNFNQERRRNERHGRVSLVQANSYVIGSSIDLSLGGARIELPRALPRHTGVRLDLLIGDLVLEIESSVVHVERIAENRYSVGLEFGELNPATKRLLEEFLASPASKLRVTLTRFEI